MNLEAIIFILTGILALIAQMVYFLKESSILAATPDKERFKKYWHYAGGAIHIWMGFMIAEMYGWQYGLLTGSLTWYFFDGAVNTWGLRKKEWWYIGTTSMLDQAQQGISKIIHLDPRLTSAILKHLMLLASIYLTVKPLI